MSAPQHSILLLDDDRRARQARALILSTHGYDVTSVSNAHDARRQWVSGSHDLVLLAAQRSAAGTLRFMEEVCRRTPRQRVGFLLDPETSLSPLFLQGRMVRPGEGADDIVARVSLLLTAHVPRRRTK